MEEYGETKGLDPAVREGQARDDGMELEITVENVTDGTELDEGIDTGITVDDAGTLDDPRLTGVDDGV